MTVCVESEAPAAFVTRLYVPSSICMVGGTLGVRAGLVVDLQLQAKEINVLAQLDDASDYVRVIHGYRTHQAGVAVAGIADVSGTFNGGRAFTPCFTLSPAPPAMALPFPLGYDILIPSLSDDDRSRGVPTHEYGHFVLCDMLNDEGAFYSTYMPMVMEGLTQGPGDTASQLNEAFADFISSQVVGGVNYFQTSGGAPPSGRSDSLNQQWYCEPASSLCVDDNIGGPPVSTSLPFGQVATDAEVTYSWSPTSDTGLFIQRTARLMTTIADVFDGQATGGNVPGNGAAWTFDPITRLFVAPVHDSFSLNDEVITLDAAPGYRGHGVNLHDVVRAFTDTHGGRLDEQFLRAMSRVMRSVGYTDTEICGLYMLHESTGICPTGAFDTPPDIVPGAPFDITHTLIAPNDAVWSWRDASPIPGDHFHYQVVVESTGVVLDDGVRPYATTQTFGRSLLPFYDRAIIFRVQTVSPSGHESPWTEHRLWTLAEPARNLHATATYPGGVPLAWDAVAATTYGVFVTDSTGRHAVAIGLTSPTFVYDMFDGGTITVDVVSYNQEVVPTAPSAPLTLTRDAAPILHVAPGGDDTADGSPGAPLATLGAAIALATVSSDITTIRIAGILPYTHLTGALEVPPGVVVRLEGGYLPDWTRLDKLTLVVASTAVLAGSSRGCGVSDAVPNGEWAAGVHVDARSRLYLDQIMLTVIPSDGHCTAAVALDSAGLDLREAKIVVKAGAANDCAVGVLGDRTTPERPTLAARDQSSITGAENLDITNPLVHVAAVCLHNADSVLLQDTTLVGISAVAGSTAVLNASAASGLVLSQGYGVDVVRSTITSVTQGPLGLHGKQTGVLLVGMLGGVRLANSVVSTTRGSDSNVAISAHSLGGAGGLSLFYVTALAGDDYDRTASLPLGHRSAPIALSGALGSVRILNSILANGAGLGEAGLQNVIAGIDRGTDRMTADPRTFELRGTGISFPFRDFEQSEALTYCYADPERFLGGIYDEATLNTDNHHCYPAVAGGSSYVASSNLAFNAGPDQLPTSGRPAVRFDSVGRPLPSAATPSTIAIDALRNAGVDLTTEFVTVPETLTLDLGGVTRVVAPPGAGAWVLPMPVTP